MGGAYAASGKSRYFNSSGTYPEFCVRGRTFIPRKMYGQAHGESVSQGPSVVRSSEVERVQCRRGRRVTLERLDWRVANRHRHAVRQTDWLSIKE